MLEVSTPGDLQIVMRRTFDAPRSKIFDAWTKPEHVARWWDPNGTPLAICEIDLRPNGAFRWVHRAPTGGEGHAFQGVYSEITPPEKLVFALQMFPGSPAPTGTLILTAAGTQTELTLTIECATKADRDALLQMRIPEGTARTLQNLARFLQPRP